MSDMTSQRAPRPAKLKTAGEALLTAAAIAAAIVLVNWLVSSTRARLDLTENQIYSLAPATKSLLGGLKEKLTVHFYVGNLPDEYSDREPYVDNLLAEMAAAGGGKVDYKKYEVDASDSEKARDKQKELAEQGISKLMLFTFKDDKRQQIPAYFHVKFTYLDKSETWTVSSGGFTLEGIEYEFAHRVARLSRGKKKLAITTGFGEPPQAQILSLDGKEAGAGGVRIGLADLYEVQMVDWKAKPTDLAGFDVILVNGPTEPILEPSLYALDQALMAGKPVLVFARGLKWAPAGDQMQAAMNPDAEMPYVGTPVETGLEKLLEHYGVKVAQDVILDGRNAVMGAIPLGRQPAETPVFFPLGKAMDNQKGGALEGFDALALPFASSLTLTGPLAGEHPGFQVRELLRTSPTSFTQPGMILVTRQWKPIPPKEGEKAGDYLNGVAISGSFKSKWAGQPGPKPVASDGSLDADAALAAATAPTVDASPADARLIVIGGNGLADDQTFAIMRFVQQPAYLNGFVAVHALVDWLVEDTVLTELRAKRVLRPIEALEASDKQTKKFANVAGVPLAVVIVGLIMWRVRESRRRRVKL